MNASVSVPIIKLLARNFIATSSENPWQEIADLPPRDQLARCRLLSRGHEDAGQNQCKADDMEQLRPLAEKYERHHGPEHRDHVEEGCRAIGADQLHPAVEAEIGYRRGKHRDIEH